ncbi:hypothetical protein F2Q68_00018724 [Brassica cretica]|uniref:Uncharacterized protein n=1 Tax=Brassica cretica TaxID=69181 RepID=A0A8S9FRR7_BRACR|nr:hypothetical protein F2Q68_00018724 [Brassica cretica]
MHISSLMKLGLGINQFEPVGLPPLMDSSPYLKSGGGDTFAWSLSHVPCFSDQTTEDKSHLSESRDECNFTMFGSSSTHLLIPNIGSILHSDPVFMQDNSSILKMLRDSEETPFKKDLQDFSTSENELTASSWHGHDISGPAAPPQ